MILAVAAVGIRIAKGRVGETVPLLRREREQGTGSFRSTFALAKCRALL